MSSQNLHDLLYFKTNRFELYDHTTKYIATANRHEAILAPVKSGKRIMVEIASLFTKARPRNFAKCHHFYVTALQRKDTKKQIEEMESYGITPLIVSSMDKISIQVAKIKAKVSSGILCYVHIDESDYGTAKKQCLGTFYRKTEKLGELVRFRYYSATNEELIYCREFSKNFPAPRPFLPPSSYRGAEWFLDKKLVTAPEQFYDNDGLTPHGLDICKDWVRNGKKTGKIISVLRDIGGSQDRIKLKNNHAVIQELHNLGIRCKFIDKTTAYEWEDDAPDAKVGVLTLLVIDRTCSRSTEVGFHNLLYFWHDYRSETSCYNSMAQAFLRVAHYDKRGHFVKVYALPEVFELAAGRITAEQYNRQLSARTGKNNERVDSYSVVILPANKTNLNKMEKMAERTNVVSGSAHNDKHRFTRNILQNEAPAFNQAIETMNIIRLSQPNKKFSEKMNFVGTIVDDGYYPIRNFSTWQFAYDKPLRMDSRLRKQKKILMRTHPDLLNKLVYIQKNNHLGRKTRHETRSSSMYEN